MTMRGKRIFKHAQDPAPILPRHHPHPHPSNIIIPVTNKSLGLPTLTSFAPSLLSPADVSLPRWRLPWSSSSWSRPMAHAGGELPCDGDGACMVCREKPPPEETIACTTCATPWHVACLPPRSRPETMADAAQWQCPDCSATDGCGEAAVPSVAVAGGDLVAAIREIERDERLTEREKAKKRQELLSGRAGEGDAVADARKNGGKEKEKGNGVMEILDGSINCSFCMQLPDRPVTVPFSCSPVFLAGRGRTGSLIPFIVFV